MVAEVAEDGTVQKAISGWQVGEANHEEQLSITLTERLALESNRNTRLAVIYGWGANSDEAKNALLSITSHNLHKLREDTEQRWQAVEEIVRDSVDEAAFPGASWLVRQALVYILACCAVPLENDSTCLITDHQLLPLAWTRDAYYAVQALLALRKQAQTSGSANAQNVITILDNIVRQHLIWLFEVAERPQGFWGRAYLTNGQCKDLIFQLDQQCYPLIELADYVEATGDKALALRLKPQLEEVLADLLARRAGAAWLFPTGETPADDKVEMPYHFSSQIAVWYSLKRLAELDILESHNPVRLREMAEQVRQDIYRYMVAENQGQKIFCYLTDLNGNYRFYHDANDWPTVLASTWGFCAVDDPIWQATLAFGFSPANQGGFYPGKVGGLGSVHTPHSWPLGDIQELFLATLLKDETRRAKCWSKLRQISAWDGSFPEAYDENSGQVASRHWFAWPGAMLAASIQLPPKSVNINR
jgi:meiotically up-regulated gene 157 (Mug157) protein